MKKIITIILLCAVLIIAGGTAGTIAYLSMKTTPVQNRFKPADVSCEITEDFDGTTKSNVAVTNTGTTKAKIRAAVLIAWVNDGGEFSGEKPIDGEDYIITYSQNGWSQRGQYYYYDQAVDPGASTEILIENCEQIREKEGYHLDVQILAEAIQAEPASAAAEAWG